ncbi:CoA transferase [Saccharopolyspora shandongensis]|uniref:CoA transferase n=1 Tax=Saccharopolyspora shandongensis TaxID=418495 RepID=UPI0034058334
MDSILSRRTTAEWLELLHANRLPAGPVNDIAEALEDPHLDAVGFFQFLDHPVAGPIRRPRCGVGFDGDQLDLAPAPRLGEHTEEVLREAGVDEATITALSADSEVR